MATDLTTPAAPTTIDVTGLPEPVVRGIRQLVDALRGEAGSEPPPPPTTGILGLYADEGIATPTLEEFQEARREMFG